MYFQKKAALMLATAFVVLMAATPYASLCYANQGSDDFDLLTQLYDGLSYEEYLTAHQNQAFPHELISIEGGDFKEASEGFLKLADYEDFAGSTVLCLDEGEVTWEFTVRESGMYNICVEYYPLTGKGGGIERKMLINDEVPFNGAQYIEFDHIWQNAEPISRDARDNDVRPKQIESPGWIKSYIADQSGYYQSAYCFFFEKGTNTISFVSSMGEMVIGSITLRQEEKPPDYEQYIAAYKDTAIYSASTIQIQGEDTLYTNDSILYPIMDRTSPMTEPYHPSKIRLNTIGGYNWRLSGQKIAWQVDIPYDGLYEIAVKFRQNIKSGTTVTRALQIDGVTPFSEAGELFFSYKNEWQYARLGTDDSPYLFYFTAGSHTISLEAVLSGEMSEILKRVRESVEELNKAYRQLLIVIGNTPDTIRDYQLELKTPDTLIALKEQYKKIQEIYNMLDQYTHSSRGSQLAVIDNLLHQLELMSADPQTIPKLWGAFKDSIVALGAFEYSMQEQPLEIDYFLIQAPAAPMPAVKANVFQQILHELRSFFASFTEDYDSVGEKYAGEALDIWILASGAAVTSSTGSGRDQATVIKNLVDYNFVPENNIPANIKLVNSDVLLSATLAGMGPDAAINVGGREPVNYALRNAAADLSAFDDFGEVRDWFHPEAFTQFTLRDGVYALPQTMSFSVMFYRADILKELGLTIPKTWDDFYQCLPVIEKSNMNVGMGADWTTYAMYLYQQGGRFYTDDQKASALDTEVAVLAFQQWTGNYVNYDLPVTFDFANRFRTGEMPLGICDYTNYNYLSVFAPEIKGLWGFTLVPGSLREDGTVDHSITASLSASMMMETSQNKEETWTFLKWWMSAGTQTSYSIEIESILGVAGRVPAANMETLGNLPWTNSEYQQLEAQLQWVKAMPEVPGGYFTERNIRYVFCR